MTFDFEPTDERDYVASRRGYDDRLETLTRPRADERLKSKKARTRMPVSRAELERLDELERRNAELEAEKAQLTLAGAPGQLAIGAAAEPEDDGGEGLARVRTEIGEMVDSQPEEVAQLLRGWLADRRT